ncbi:type II toxin-antitoxin system PemK/MazF family toxin [Galactobacillus timonensis]|uniref:type II toxin-antitoxin system PemK/MazF family toxin n=1 Tax=Galactobacillus timonensis TaxID=2041840 RepID=UPI001FD9CFCD|nr:type II toxin-antitoxin system PemK/MazF family toxin [Galactobacillus timonensis]
MGNIVEMNQRISSDWIYQRGDIYIANLNPYTGAEQGGIRPVLVLQNNIGNLYSPTLIVAPMTKEIKRIDLPTHVYIRCTGDLKSPSMVALEQIRTIDKSRLHRYIGRLSPLQMALVDKGIRRSLGIVTDPEYDHAS